MLTTKRQSSIVGIDVEAGSVAATEVRTNGSAELIGHAIAPLDPGVVRDGEIVDAEALGRTLKELFSEHKLSRDVRLGIASQRVVVRTLRLPPIENDEELENAIRFQAQDQIPMPLEQAVLDWEVVNRRNGEDPSGVPGIDVVAVAARRDMVATAMEAMREASLRPVAIDLSAFGMIRALAGTQAASPQLEPEVGAPELSYEERMAQQPAVETAPLADPALTGAPAPARLFCHLGDVVNLAVAQGRSCLFTRISLHGIEGIAQRLAERQQLTLEHARQWLLHVGLASPVEQIDGDAGTVAAARDALGEGVGKLVEELRVSLEFYGAQEGATPIEDVVACGPGSAIPGLVERLQHELGYPFAVGRPPALGHLDDAAAARLTLSYGLALEE